VHRKRELLAQLKDKYGDDPDTVTENDTEREPVDNAFDWMQVGNLSVDVLEASMPLISARIGLRFKAKITLHRKQGSQVFQSTSWAPGSTPSWNDKFKFERCSRHDVLVFQVPF